MRWWYKTMRKDSPDMAKHHNYLCRAVKRSAKKDKENYIQSVCKEVQEARVQNKMRAVYQGIRKITSKYAPQVKSIKDKHSKILTEPV